MLSAGWPGSTGEPALCAGKPFRAVAGQEETPVRLYSTDALSEFAGPQALRQLLDAVMSISADLVLAAVLRRIVPGGARRAATVAL